MSDIEITGVHDAGYLENAAVPLGTDTVIRRRNNGSLEFVLDTVSVH
ncbi:hypothetical protein [Marivita sp. XM-24bin2]|nr:hypothetical protein [Marivita sp. XM-24bin2]MCR9107539.1 hypothetical protein [Paracoccaceae bacterium]